MDADDLRFLLQRPIAFHRVFATIARGATSGLFLSQLFYWSDKGADPDGWIYKTQDEWEEETALTRSEQERARKILKDLGLLQEERRGVPARLFYRLDVAKLASLLDPAVKDARFPQTSVADPAIKVAGSATPSSITETTAETTQTAPHSLDHIHRALHAPRIGRR